MSYAGICVGGPLAGKMCVSASTHLAVDTPPPLPSLVGGPQPLPLDVRVTVTRTSYHFDRIAGVGLWILEGETLADAMGTLALVYANGQT